MSGWLPHTDRSNAWYSVHRLVPIWVADVWRSRARGLRWTWMVTRDGVEIERGHVSGRSTSADAKRASETAMRRHLFAEMERVTP